MKTQGLSLMMENLFKKIYEICPFDLFIHFQTTLGPIKSLSLPSLSHFGEKRENKIWVYIRHIPRRGQCAPYPRNESITRSGA
jgi:hypothetical protein